MPPRPRVLECSIGTAATVELSSEARPIIETRSSVPTYGLAMIDGDAWGLVALATTGEGSSLDDSEGLVQR